MGRRKGDQRFMVQCKQVTSGALASIRKHEYFYSPHECISSSFARFPPRIVHFGYVNVAS